MIIQCGSCGLIKNIPHEGTPEEIEQGIADTIEEGWRYVKSYDGYICPGCRKEFPDKLYEAYVGRPKAVSKEDSYRSLLGDILTLIENLKRFD